MGTHPIFESDFDCLTENKKTETKKKVTKCPKQCSSPPWSRWVSTRIWPKSPLAKLVAAQYRRQWTGSWLIQILMLKRRQRLKTTRRTSPTCPKSPRLQKSVPPRLQLYRSG